MYKTKQKRSVTGELAQVEERPLSTREVFNFVSCLYLYLYLAQAIEQSIKLDYPPL